jgi:hypothetical protein
MADQGGSSNPNPKGPTRGNDSSLAVSHNGNVANFTEDPPVKNESPAVSKSYSWNKGATGNGNGPR